MPNSPISESMPLKKNQHRILDFRRVYIALWVHRPTPEEYEEYYTKHLFHLIYVYYISIIVITQHVKSGLTRIKEEIS